MRHHYDPVVLDRRAVAMQRLADAVRRGHVHWTSGRVHHTRARALVDKFCRLYGVHLHRNRRARLRLDGQASAVLLLVREHTADIRFYLLLTAGAHAAHTLEQLQDATSREGRLRLDGYELVRSTREGGSRASWTWRMVEDEYLDWRARALSAARRGPPTEGEDFLQELHKCPGFAGIRRQTAAIRRLLLGEWRRRRGAAAPFPHGERHRYVQRLPNSGAPLSLTLRHMKRLFADAGDTLTDAGR